MSKDNDTNMTKSHDDKSVGNPNSKKRSIWDGLTHPHIKIYALHLAVRIDMFLQPRHHKERRDNIIRL